jgi:CRP/FNR family cyclic AMP-dependent transcriptional regulator
VDAPYVRRRRLSSSPLCRGLSETELDEILAIAEDVEVQNGKNVFKQGDPADSLFFVARGRIEISKDGQVLASLGIGEVLGELSVLGGSHKRSATARATTEVLVVRIATRTFRKLLEEWNVAAMKIVVNLAEQLTERMVSLNDKLIAANKKDERPVVPVPHSHWKL